MRNILLMWNKQIIPAPFGGSGHTLWDLGPFCLAPATETSAHLSQSDAQAKAGTTIHCCLLTFFCLCSSASACIEHDPGLIGNSGVQSTGSSSAPFSSPSSSSSSCAPTPAECVRLSCAVAIGLVQAAMLTMMCDVRCITPCSCSCHESERWENTCLYPLTRALQ